MTICIAALCDGGREIVAASDRMITVSPLSQEFEHGTPKVDMLSSNCMSLSAGSALLPDEVYVDLEAEIAALKEPRVSGIVEKVKDRYAQVRRKKVEEELLRPRGFTLQSFYEKIKTLPPQIAVPLDGKIQDYDGFNLELVIAGVDKTGAHVFEIEDPGTSACFDSLGYVCIGSGEPHAFSSFIANEYTPSVTSGEGMYVAYEAKKRAEKAPGVGPSTDMWVINGRGIQSVPAAKLATLERVYQMKVKLEKERSKEINKILDGLSRSRNNGH